MKYTFLIVLLAFSFMTGFACGNKGQTVANNLNAQNNNNMSDDTMNNKIVIKIGSGIFTATLTNNATATAFKALLPITVNMEELNGNEKYFDLSKNLPANASNPGTIQNGDLMLYGSNTLVLFYKTFSTTYSYTRLGRIDNTSGLAAAAGSESVTVTFEVEKKL